MSEIETRMRELIKELADELESEIEYRYIKVKDHPVMRPKFERDMETVYIARRFLEAS